MELISTHTVVTSDLGVRGNLFGGRTLSWMDLAASAFGTQAVGCVNLVTLKVSECIFHRPAKINNLIKIYGEVVKIGNTSITLRIEARRYDVLSAEEDMICSTTVVMVRVDEHGKPISIASGGCKK